MVYERYERQLPLQEIGKAGQEYLLASSVLVVGCGGLGSTLLYCLCGMGVGRIGFCDGDTVSLNNLNRQFLHTDADIGRNKARSAYEKLSAFAPELKLEPMEFHLSDVTAKEIVSKYNLVLLAVDSLPSRLIVNRACVAGGVPLVDAGINGFHGSLLTIRPGETPCLACVYGEGHPTKTPIPSFAPIVSVIASLEAQCAANILLGLPNPTDGKLLLFDGETMTTEFISLNQNKDCPVCGQS